MEYYTTFQYLKGRFKTIFFTLIFFKYLNKYKT